MKCTERMYQLHIENVGSNPCANNLWGRSSNHSHTTWPSNKYSISKDIISLCMAIGWQHGWMHTHITAASILSLTYDWVAVVIWILLDVRLYECAAASQPHHRDHSQLKLIQNQTLDWFWEPCSRETTVYVCYAFTFSLTFLKSVFCLRCCVYCSKSIDCASVFFLYIYIYFIPQRWVPWLSWGSFVSRVLDLFITDLKDPERLRSSFPCPFQNTLEVYGWGLGPESPTQTLRPHVSTQVCNETCLGTTLLTLLMIWTTCSCHFLLDKLQRWRRVAALIYPPRKGVCSKGRRRNFGFLCGWKKRYTHQMFCNDCFIDEKLERQASSSPNNAETLSYTWRKDSLSKFLCEFIGTAQCLRLCALIVIFLCKWHMTCQVFTEVGQLCLTTLCIYSVTTRDLGFSNHCLFAFMQF